MLLHRAMGLSKARRDDERLMLARAGVDGDRPNGKAAGAVFFCANVGDDDADPASCGFVPPRAT